MSQAQLEPGLVKPATVRWIDTSAVVSRLTLQGLYRQNLIGPSYAVFNTESCMIGYIFKRAF
jgi:hypothetical protein